MLNAVDVVLRPFILLPITAPMKVSQHKIPDSLGGTSSLPANLDANAIKPFICSGDFPVTIGVN